MTETEIEDESKTVARYNQLKQKMAKLQVTVVLAFKSGETISVQDRMKVQAMCLKKMLTLVKKIKTVDKRIVLRRIIEEAFDLSCLGFLIEKQHGDRTAAKAAWMQDAETFAAIGLDWIKTLNGEDHSDVQLWKARVAHPVQFFEKEQLELQIKLSF